MSHPVRTHLIKIGNSQGVRLPKAIVEQAGLVNELTIEVVDGAVLIKSAAHARASWTAAFATIAPESHKSLLDGEESIPNQWDEEEWTW